MSPDLNAFPPSPRPANTSSNNPSRRTSQIMSQGRPHSNMSTHEPQGGVPVRHPRPLTPAELHLELEREQESIVRKPCQHPSPRIPHVSSSSHTSTTLWPEDVRNLQGHEYFTIALAGCEIPRLTGYRRVGAWFRNVLRAALCRPPHISQPDDFPDPMHRQMILAALLENMGIWINASNGCLTREQVNRLTRELAALRAQSASALSNHSASSHSSSAVHDTGIESSSQPPSATQPYFPLTGPTHPTPSRIRRSSSSVSRRSDASQATMPPPAVPFGSSQASVDRARDAVGSITSPLQRSRQNSTVLPAAAHHSGITIAPSPSPSPSQRNSHVSLGDNAGTQPSHSLANARPPSISLSSSMSSLHGIQSPTVGARDAGLALRDAREEAASAKQQLDLAKAENEALARRVKELEREVRRMKSA